MSPFQALVAALVLAVTAPSEGKASDALAIAQGLADSLSEHEVARAKREAEHILAQEV
jgi:hypothetical protein